MEYKITKLQNDKGLDIDIVNIINSNNYSFSFYTYGGYMSEVCIPTSSNVSETEDVLLGYGNLDDVWKLMDILIQLLEEFVIE